ncbi:MAG TPA: HEAT repeat domain-containing protein [Gemmatimonadaceae bacterium]|nr:HEAT repeat domain-containing protein [Gemmatimonadaceae bacterium]
MRFIVSSTITLVSVVSITATTAALAQSLAQRVSATPDGVVHLQFPSRPGACGNGRDMVGYRKALFADSFESMGTWHSSDCVPGPVRVGLSISGGKVVRVRTSVGGSWPRTSERVTDLGEIAAPQAASYFFSLVPVVERAGDKSRVLLPAVLADAGDITPQLTAIARDAERLTETRRQAIHWLGIVGDARVVPTLVAFARAGGAGPSGGDIDEDDDAPGKKGLATSAMAALSFVANHAGIPALIDLARSGSAGTRGAAVFWLGQSGDPRALATLHTVIENTREDQRVRERAIFSLSHGEDVPAAEYAYLRNIFPRLGAEKLKKAVLMGMSEDSANGSSWLIEKARDASESMEIRKTALFWAGQRELTPTRDLASFYRTATEPALREHAIFVLSQRDDEAAFNELMRIAQADADKRMRAKALFWLGQKDDPRVAKMIQDRIER